MELNLKEKIGRKQILWKKKIVTDLLFAQFVGVLWIKP